ncbi:hypothetical protein E8E12_011649 [Didymella heteroderae]|uniref:Uncharacterized protein n=1 Tax=Didymella heteroderae TaxID=1769908 RepID=A0A9P4X2Y2_9PLEO|nr:hypothetical protein E8E12_011649 [Didymella heteroderae]
MTKVAGVLMQILWDPRGREMAALPGNTKTATQSGRSERRSACEVCLFAQQSLFAEAVEERVAGVSGVVKHPCAGIEGSGGSPETKTSLLLIALLRVAYERIRPGSTAFTRSRPEMH